MPNNTSSIRNFERKDRTTVPLVPGQTMVKPPNSCGTLEIPVLGQSYYVYASTPKLASMDRAKDKEKDKLDKDENESSEDKVLPLTTATQNYYNMMWDPRIFRGTTFTTFYKAEEKRNKRYSMDASTNKRKKLKPGALLKLAEKKLGGINRPRTPTHHTDQKGLEDMGIQTEQFLQEITDEIKEKEMYTQTDAVFDGSFAPLFCTIKVGKDVATQIQAWELFNFEEEAKPIMANLVGKIIEQALFETMEETELENLREQQSVFEEEHRQHLMRLQRLQIREQKLTEERTQLVKERQVQVESERGAETRIAVALFSANYLQGMANGVLTDLRRDGHLDDNDGLEESFIPWLHNRSIWQFCKRLSAITLLNDMIKHVVDDREGDVADGIWREISAQNHRYEEGPASGMTYFSALSEGYDGGE